MSDKEMHEVRRLSAELEGIANSISESACPRDVRMRAASRLFVIASQLKQMRRGDQS